MYLPKDITYRMLSEHLHGLSKEEQREFKARVIEYFDFNDWGAFEERCGRDKGPNLGSRSEARHSLEYMRLLHYGFGVPFAGYGFIEDSAFFSNYKGGIRQSSVVESEYIGGWPTLPEQDIDYATKYVNIVEKYIDQSNERIWIYEYLGKGRTRLPGLKLAHYSEAHKQLFARYEAQLSKHPTMEYCRLLALPISEQEEENPQVRIQDAVIKCSAQLFTHMCSCLKSYKDRVRFIVVMMPTRIYHYVLFDKKFIFTEFYKYNRDGDFLPDLLFVERVLGKNHKHTRLILNIYENEIEEIITGSGRGRQLSKEELIDATLQAYKSICQQLENPVVEGIKLEILKRKEGVLKEKIKILQAVFPEDMNK